MFLQNDKYIKYFYFVVSKFKNLKCYYVLSQSIKYCFFSDFINFIQNQLIRIIKCFITNWLNYVISRMLN